MKQLLITASLLTALAACGGTGATNPPGTSTDVCNTAAAPLFTLISPAPGATGVSDATATLQFQGALYTGGTPSIALTTATGTSTLTGFTPTVNGYSVALPKLASGTTYTVNYVVNVANAAPACATMTQNEGSFTTQ